MKKLIFILGLILLGLTGYSQAAINLDDAKNKLKNDSNYYLNTSGRAQEKTGNLTVNKLIGDTVELGINKVLIVDDDDDSYIYCPVDDQISFYSANAQRVYISGSVTGINTNVTPVVNNSRNMGTSSVYWLNTYTRTLNADTVRLDDGVSEDTNPDSILVKNNGKVEYTSPTTGTSLSAQSVADSLSEDAVFDSIQLAGAIVGDADVVAGLKTWEHTGTAVDTITISGVKTYDMYMITFASDPGAPADWWFEAKVDSVIIHTGANVTGTPSYAWFRFRKY